MGTPVDAARQAVVHAEARLRELIGGAATAADYDSVRRLTAAAERLVLVSAELSTAPALTAPTTTALRTTNVVRRGPDTSSHRSKRDYPRYECRSGVLWRVGWSKKSKSEYVHKVPRGVYERIVDALARMARSNGALISVEEIMKELDKTENSDTPVYQIYATLGLLGLKGHVAKRGREGYRVSSAQSLSAQAWQAWEGVLQHR